MLGLFSRHVHFKQDRLREPSLPGRSIKALGHLQPIHGMQQREASDRRLDLVRLERTDQMPLQTRVSVQSLHLDVRLLNAVLAEHPAPASRRLAQSLDGARFRHGHQGDAPGIAPGPPRRALDASPHCIQPTLENVADAWTDSVLYSATVAGSPAHHGANNDPAEHAGGSVAYEATRVVAAAMEDLAAVHAFEPGRTEADRLRLTAV